MTSHSSDEVDTNLTQMSADKRYEGTLLLISHDRTFLASVVDHIAACEGNDIATYKGNYSAFENLRAEKMALQQAMFAKQQKRKAKRKKGK